MGTHCHFLPRPMRTYDGSQPQDKLEASQPRLPPPQAKCQGGLAPSRLPHLMFLGVNFSLKGSSFSFQTLHTPNSPWISQPATFLQYSWPGAPVGTLWWSKEKTGWRSSIGDPSSWEWPATWVHTRASHCGGASHSLSVSRCVPSMYVSG